MSYVEAHAMHVRQREHDAISAEVAAFIAQGGPIERIPAGQQTDLGTANPRRLTSALFSGERPAPQPATLGGRILAILRTHGPQTTAQLYGWLPETTPDTVRSTLNNLRKTNRVAKDGKNAPWRLK